MNRSLSDAFGQLYVEKYFPASSKDKMIEMVGNLQAALGERIAALDWMSDETKAKAQEKLGTFIVKVGYPDTWMDYTALEIKDDSYWANICLLKCLSPVSHGSCSSFKKSCVMSLKSAQ